MTHHVVYKARKISVWLLCLLMPYYNNQRSRYSRRSMGSRSSYRTSRPYRHAYRRPFRPRRRIAQSGIGRNLRAFGAGLGEARRPPPYLTRTTEGPLTLECGDGLSPGSRHIVTRITVDAADWLTGTALTVSLPMMDPGGIYVAEVLCTTAALTVGSTTTMNQNLPYLQGGSHRIPTRSVAPGHSWSRKRLIITRASTKKTYFRLNVQPQIAEGGLPTRTKVYLLEHIYGAINGERHYTKYIRSYVCL